MNDLADTKATLTEKISSDLHVAMKGGDKVRVSTLRLLLAQIMNERISLKKDILSGEEELKILQKEIKKRKESAEMFIAGGRLSSAENERAEKDILEKYLPPQLSDNELEDIIRGVINENPSEKHVGKIMGKIIPMVKDKADGGRIKTLVEKVLLPDS
jgi:hypothetical protein